MSREHFGKGALWATLCAVVTVVVDLSATGYKQAQEKEFARPFDVVWTAIVQVLQGRGESITQADKENGLINTDFRSEDKDKKHYKLNLLVSKASDSTTKVSVTCAVEKRSGSIWANKRGRWEAKESDGSHEKAVLEEIEKALQ
jgi:hypothetical protein